MKSNPVFLLVTLMVLLWVVPVMAQEKAAQPEQLGTVHFPVSCTAEAQQLFDRAIALYHSFYWPEVKKAFEAVCTADPACAMAYWGHAMVLLDNPFLWPLTGKNLPEGLAMLEKAKAIRAGLPCTSRQ